MGSCHASELPLIQQESHITKLQGLRSDVPECLVSGFRSDAAILPSVGSALRDTSRPGFLLTSEKQRRWIRALSWVTVRSKGMCQTAVTEEKGTRMATCCISTSCSGSWLGTWPVDGLEGEVAALLLPSSRAGEMCTLGVFPLGRGGVPGKDTGL